MKKKEFMIVAILVVICVLAAALAYRPTKGAQETVAVISVDGAEFQRIILSKTTDGIFSIASATGKPVSFEVKEGAIRFVNVTCPDHVCERAGWCDAPGERAVCMPNRTTLICYATADMV